MLANGSGGNGSGFAANHLQPGALGRPPVEQIETYIGGEPGRTHPPGR